MKDCSFNVNGKCVNVYILRHHYGEQPTDDISKCNCVFYEPDEEE